jgi:hypothetical protein
MEQELIKEVKRMNGFLEAIDWKLWEIYKKMSGNTSASPGAPESAQAPPAAVPIETEVKSEPVQVVVPVIPVPSYPNIEKWK